MKKLMEENSRAIKKGYDQKHKQKMSCDGKENSYRRKEKD